MQAAFLFSVWLDVSFHLTILDYLGNSHQYALCRTSTVSSQSVAIVERFGRYQKIATSGIHMRLPFGIDKIQLVFNYVCFKVRLWLKPKQRTMSLL